MKASFLVRFWTEPAEQEGGEPVVRGYLRNLHTGEERYVEGPQTVGDLMLRHLRAEIAQERREEQAGEQAGA